MVRYSRVDRRGEWITVLVAGFDKFTSYVLGDLDSIVHRVIGHLSDIVGLYSTEASSCQTHPASGDYEESEDTFTGRVSMESNNSLEGNNTSGNHNGQGNPGNHPFKNLPDGQVCLP